jgi:hypothetical protein
MRAVRFMEGEACHADGEIVEPAAGLRGSGATRVFPRLSG